MVATARAVIASFRPSDVGQGGFMGLGWFGAPEHNRWLAAETHALLHYGRAAKVPAGFGWIGEDGAVDAGPVFFCEFRPVRSCASGKNGGSEKTGGPEIQAEPRLRRGRAACGWYRRLPDRWFPHWRRPDKTALQD